MTQPIGILTGGGDCPGLNTVIRSVVKAARLRGWDTVGIEGGFEGFLPPVRSRPLDYHEIDRLLFRGGTVLGTASRGVFAAKTGHGEVRRIPRPLVDQALAAIRALDLRGLVCVGGDGTLTVAQQLFEAGAPLVGVPKTIDNDLDATHTTFGFDSAVSCAVDALDRLSTTAESHGRVMVLEVMGRHAGWIAAYAGLAGGADVILIPEIPFRYEAVCAKIARREAEGKAHTLVIVAEGAHEEGGAARHAAGDDEDGADSPPVREAESAEGEVRLGGIGAIVADEVQRRTGRESRSVVLGHLQRGGAPTPVDRQLCTRFGVRAVELLAEARFGMMVASRPPAMVPVPIREAIGRIRRVDPDGELVQTARAIGTCFGNEPSE